MKNFILPQRFLFRCFTVGILGLAANEIIAQEVYKFHCKDYVSTDANRAPQSAFSYNEAENNFTISATGNMNIAFQMDKKKDGAYYINNKQEWLLIEGTDINTDKTQSNIWWLNGVNSYPGSEPVHAITNTDGNTILLWNIKTDEDLSKGFDFTSPTIFLSSNGAEFFQAMGVTSTGNKSTINNIGYYSAYEAAATYPILIPTLGFTEESLTEEIKKELDNLISEANTLLEKANESDSKTELEKSVNNATSTSSTAGSTDYTLLFNELKTLNTAIEKFKTGVYAFGYEKTANGIHATLNDMHIHVMLYNNDIVRVYKSHEETINKESLSVIAQPQQNISFDVTENGDIVTIGTDRVKVLYNQQTGQVEVQRADATTLIKEKENSTKFLPYKDNEYDKYQIMHSFLLDEDEAIFGLGQIQNGLLNQRGQSIYLHQENMKVCIPYFQSDKNYALFWDNYSPTTFTDNSEGTSFQSTGNAIDYYVLCGENSNDVLSQMRELTGDSPMPALWNLGLYQSKERYQSATETMDVVKRYRELGVPLDCIVQDWQYWGDNYHWNAMEFLNPTFSNYEEMIKSVHDNNAKLMISIWANFGPETKPFKELDEMGRLIPVNTYPNGYGVRPYDVYGEKARDTYWKYLYEGLVNKGIDAYWMDSSEPDYYQVNANDFDYVTEDGKTWRSVRNAFPLAHVGGVYDHHRAAEKANDPYLKGKRVSILTRSAFAGQQRYGANTWSGDVVSSWENLAKQIPAACNLSVCGIPFWNSDIGGFFTWNYSGTNDPAWRQLYLRWTQFGTFTPMMRFHGTGLPREIYQFGSANDGNGDYDQILKYVKMRYRMLPYLYSTAWQISQYDKTFMQALPLAFNGDKNGYDITDEYMFGDAFLVAPIVEEATNQRNVYLPANNKWIDFWTGETLEGGQTVLKSANLDIIPLYVKAGSILPWGPDVQYSTEKKWDNLEIRVYPGQDGSFVLYEDENDNYNYEQGQYTEIPFTWNEAEQTLTIGARKGQFEGMLEKRVFNITKVSTCRGTGDLHETNYHASIEYTGEEVKVTLIDKIEETTREDLTNLIQNPSFEADGSAFSGRAPKGWNTNCNTTWWGVNNGGNGGKNDPRATDGQYIFGVWDGNNNKNAEISQEITLNAGYYEITVDMHAPNQGTLKRVGNQRIFANENVALFKDQVITYGTSDNTPMQTIKLKFKVENDNTPVKIGVSTDGAQDQTWYKIDNFRLYKVDEPKTAFESVNLNVTDNGWATAILPFNVEEIPDGIKVYTCNSIDKDYLILNEADNMQENTPYIVSGSGLYTFSGHNSAIKDSYTSGLLTGVYNTVTAPIDSYVLQNQGGEVAFYKVYEGMEPEVTSNHVYLQLPAEMAESNVKVLYLDRDVTGIDNISENENKKVDVYNINGIKVRSNVKKSNALNSLPKGIYIIDGVKVVK